MSRRKFLGKAAAGLAAGALAAPAVVRAQPVVQWRMAASWPKSLDTLFGALELIAQRVADGTEGKFQIRVFAAGEIVPALQVLDAVQAGTVEAGHTATYYYVGKEPAFALPCSIPFGLTARQNFAWWHFGGGAEAMAPLFSEYGCVALAAGNTGCQMGGWFRKEIKSLADLKGLKFRVAGMAGLVFAKVGVVPQMIAGPDIYPSLEKGTIDGAEWVGPYDDEKLGFQRVARHYYYPGWWEAGTTGHLLVNEKAWAALPKAYQSVLASACAEACVRMLAKYDAQNPQALRRLVAQGASLRPFPKPVLEACEKATYALYDELSAKSAHWRRIYPAWKKFRDDQFLWFRVAEASYENHAFHSKLGASR
jgi:TRAP-type mannitol/chloroaromatic compound transport system substrate-binding protein